MPSSALGFCYLKISQMGWALTMAFPVLGAVTSSFFGAERLLRFLFSFGGCYLKFSHGEDLLMTFQFWGLLPQVFSVWRGSDNAFLSYWAVTSSFFGVEGSYDAFSVLELLPQLSLVGELLPYFILSLRLLPHVFLC